MTKFDLATCVALAKALSDENRLRILMALRGRELCICQLIAMLKLAPSTVSKHISLLKQAGLVDSRKQGRWIYIRLSEAEASPVAAQALCWAADCLEHDKRIEGDERALARLLRMTVEELCRVRVAC